MAAGWLLAMLACAPSALRAEAPAEVTPDLGARLDACFTGPSQAFTGCIAALPAEQVAQELQRREAAFRDADARWRAQLIGKLQGSENPRHLLLLARLYGEPRDPRVAPLLREVMRRGGDDADLMRLIAVGEFSGADDGLRAEALSAWRRLEPDNAIAWVSTEGGERALSLQELEGAAGATRVDSGHFRNLRWLVDGLRQLPPPPGQTPDALLLPNPSPQQALAMAAYGMWTAMAQSALQPLAQACGVRALQREPARRALCRRVATVLMDHADTHVTASIAVLVASNVAANEEERARLQDRRRENYWLAEQFAQLETDLVHLLVQFEDRIEATEDPTMNELNFARQHLQAAGIALTPPPGWRPLAERAPEAAANNDD